MDILLLLWLFTVKHFLVDFVFQTAEEVTYKGTYLDWRGVKHSVKHGIGTLLVLWVAGAGLELGYLYAAADFLIHYHIDWTKMNMSKHLTPADHAFWVWLGFDQALHYLTYIMFIAIMIT
jgi:hypothetical protein